MSDAYCECVLFCFQERNRDYVIQLEVYLSKLLNADGTRDEEDEELM